MADLTRRWTDKKLASMEREIAKIYKQAEKELTKKWNAYMLKASASIDEAYDKFALAGTSKDPEVFDKAYEEYNEAVQSYTLRNDHYKAMVDRVTKDMAQINQMALRYLNGELTNVYANSYELSMKSSVEGLGVNFELVDFDTVMGMIEKGDIETPFMRSPKYLDIPKDRRWNTKKINSSVLQGILQGESMQKIAKRLLPIVNSNKKAAIRNARTLVNGAENSGRLDSYKNLQSQGAVLKKIWDATNDSRTRDWHRGMEGQEVDIDEKFIDGNGNKLDFPADPKAKAETVYNCRCTMHTRVIGFRDANGKIHLLDEGQQPSKTIDFESEKLKGVMSESDYKEFAGLVEKADNANVWADYAEDDNDIIY